MLYDQIRSSAISEIWILWSLLPIGHVFYDSGILAIPSVYEAAIYITSFTIEYFTFSNGSKNYVGFEWKYRFGQKLILLLYLKLKLIYLNVHLVFVNYDFVP